MSEQETPERQTHRNLSDGIRTFFARRPHAVPSVIATILLFAAIGKWPYDYYKIMRWVVCAAAVLIAFSGFRWRQFWATWLFGILAVMFNPLVPVHFSKATWQWIDSVAAVLFLISAAMVHKPKR